MANLVKSYDDCAQKTSDPRELEAQLLMRAAAKLQAVKKGMITEMADVISVLRYNRRLWLIFADSVSRPDNRLPIEIKRNVTKLAFFIINHSMTLETATEPKPDEVDALININCQIAAGLRAEAA